ncbi:uncharacterized protein LOC143366360 [Andrena cerasifolii]|uniref:uncharacterized protein LOC143366360 n=1 Tax=Andrena cerasifolii TaxID=2819439 RepID=UPI004037D486
MNFSVFLMICVGSLSLDAAVLEDKKYCFQYTWIAPMFNNKLEKYECPDKDEHSKVPCFEPVIYTEDEPDPHELWENENTTMMCSLTSGNVCLRYTFVFNKNIVNTTLFCGKAIEDQATPITSGCYQQSVDGYVIEVCACESRKGKEPCNSTMAIKYSIVLMIISLAFVIANSVYR